MKSKNVGHGHEVQFSQWRHWWKMSKSTNISFTFLNFRFGATSAHDSKRQTNRHTETEKLIAIGEVLQIGLEAIFLRLLPGFVRAGQFEPEKMLQFVWGIRCLKTKCRHLYISSLRHRLILNTNADMNHYVTVYFKILRYNNSTHNH